MYGAETLQQAHQLLSRESRYFGLNNLGANMEGSEMHKQLLLAYHKVNAKKR
jgi:ribosomal protein S12 methylthiotransferase accessory factor